MPTFVLLLATLLAAPPSREEAARRLVVVAQMQAAIAEAETPAAKSQAALKAMAAEPNAPARGRLLNLAIGVAGIDFDSLLGKALADEDAAIRSSAAKALGKFGGEKSLPLLARSAASDPTTRAEADCIVHDSSARRAATFALADLADRFPKLKDQAADELRKLKTPAIDAADNESLADARAQSLYRVTRDDAWLKPFYDRLKSKDARVRERGVVAFQFLELKTAPAELVRTLTDDDEQVRAWAVLVLGAIGDPGVIPTFIARAEDTQFNAGERSGAVSALGRMRAAAATENLRKLLKDDQESVQVSAAIALYRITGEKAPQFPEGYNAE